MTAEIQMVCVRHFLGPYLSVIVRKDINLKQILSTHDYGLVLHYTLQNVLVFHFKYIY